MATAFSPTERMRLARKTSSIDQLSKQFRQQVAALTGEQEKAFSTYQAGVTEKMAPFESALAQYQTKDFPAYEAAAEAYKGRLDAYLTALRDIQTNPNEVISPTSSRPLQVGRTVTTLYSFPGIQVPVAVGRGTQMRSEATGADFISAGYDFSVVDGQARITRPKPTPAAFTETAPTAPAAPTRPEIAAFSDEPFQARRAELEQGLQRELGERRSARLAAVSRRSRNMLSGA